jgi:hypothetical protein
MKNPSFGCSCNFFQVIKQITTIHLQCIKTIAFSLLYLRIISVTKSSAASCIQLSIDQQEQHFLNDIFTKPKSKRSILFHSACSSELMFVFLPISPTIQTTKPVGLKLQKNSQTFFAN